MLHGAGNSVMRTLLGTSRIVALGKVASRHAREHALARAERWDTLRRGSNQRIPQYL